MVVISDHTKGTTTKHWVVSRLFWREYRDLICISRGNRLDFDLPSSANGDAARNLLCARFHPAAHFQSTHKKLSTHHLNIQSKIGWME